MVNESEYLSNTVLECIQPSKNRHITAPDENRCYAILVTCSVCAVAVGGLPPALNAAAGKRESPLDAMVLDAPVAGVVAGVAGKLAGIARGRATAESVVTAGLRAF